MKLDFVDGLIWIGRSYKEILCDHENPDCYVLPYVKGTRCYVHEAANRGCCRKVPNIPHGIELGKTRIFLIHRDDLRCKSEGHIFGYYVLSMIEGILPARTLSALCSRDVKRKYGQSETGNLKVRVLRADRGIEINNARVEVFSQMVFQPTLPWRLGGYVFADLPAGEFEIRVCAPGYEPEQVRGVQVKVNRTYVLDVYLKVRKIPNGDFLTKTCWDGSTIITHVYQNNGWIQTDERCPRFPPHTHCRKDQVRTQKCWDGSTIVIARCIKGEWIPTGQKCPKFPWPGDPPPPIHPDLPSADIDITFFEEERDCSLRIKPRGIYFLDSLAKEISEKFKTKKELSTIQHRYLRAGNDKGRLAAVQEGRNIFNNLAKKIAEERENRRPRTVIPQALSGKAELRGEFVFFKNPLILRRSPQAAFRGVIKINGDKILEAIQKKITRISIEDLR